eukprot:scaffold573194_cov18-Prasinocladus_malaysianus.AAC.1
MLSIALLHLFAIAKATHGERESEGGTHMPHTCANEKAPGKHHVEATHGQQKGKAAEDATNHATDCTA